MLPIFDGHNDVLLRLMRKAEPDGGCRSFLEGDGAGHLDLPRAKAGGLVGGLFAVFVPTPEPDGDRDDMMRAARIRRSACRPRPRSRMRRPWRSRWSRCSSASRAVPTARVRVCRNAAEIRAGIDAGALSTVLHLEGAEPIDRDFKMLEVLYEAGLRSIGLVWSRPNLFGHGVPFRFPSSPDTGAGLTEEGRALVTACNELKVLLDLSHLNEKGFWDVAALSNAPLVATHSNAHVLCPHSRNLTDKQLAAIRESGGLVGINFATCFLRSDGRMLADTPLEDVVRHADHLIEHLGVDGVGFGSDFDGAVIPQGMANAAGLQALVEAFRAAGYDDATLAKLCSGNWLRVLERTWGA